MEHHAGGVDHPPQGGPGQLRAPAEDGLLQLIQAGDGRQRPGPQGGAVLVQHLAGRLPPQGVGQGAARQGGAGEKQIHFGQRTQQFRLLRDPSRVSFG